MSLERCMQEHTHRQFLGWDAWLEEQWNRPDRNDHYLMQIAVTIQRLLAKNPKSIKLSNFKLSFEREALPGSIADLKRQREEAKKSERTWLQYFGIVPMETEDD